MDKMSTLLPFRKLTKPWQRVICPGRKRMRAEDMGGREEDEGTCAPACGGIKVPTTEELAALNAMRNIKKQVRILKGRLSEIASGGAPGKPGEEDALHEELERLRGQWESWERKRRKAAHDRMVLLGHKDPFREP
jgi:hypothetical protein